MLYFSSCKCLSAGNNLEAAVFSDQSGLGGNIVHNLFGGTKAYQKLRGY